MARLRLCLLALLQVCCSTTRLRELATPSRSATLSTPARKRRLRWPRRPSCGQRSMTASPAARPAGWTIRQSGEETFHVPFLPEFLTGCYIVFPLLLPPAHLYLFAELTKKKDTAIDNHREYSYLYVWLMAKDRNPFDIWLKNYNDLGIINSHSNK